MLTVTRPASPELKTFTAYVEAIFREHRFTNQGPLNSLLEIRLRELIGARYLALVSNGTAALELALRALGATGEVITTPYSFVASAHAIVSAGCRPVFVDIEPQSLTLDPARIEAMITPDTRGILGVHVYGNACDVRAIDEIAKRHGLFVVYDAAHAFNRSINGVSIGSFGDAVTYSFHATKLFHTGEGGAVQAADDQVARRVELMRNFGIENEETISLVGTNAKMSELAAALGLANLEWLSLETKRRARVRQGYDTRLTEVDGIQLVQPPSQPDRPQAYYVVRVKGSGRRDRLYAALRESGILTRKYFHLPLSRLSMYQQCRGADDESLPVTLNACAECLALPFYGEMTPEDVGFVCDRITRIMKDG